VGAQATYTLTVHDYGGAITEVGQARFRRYRVAEICARLLRIRLGLVPGVCLSRVA
jgi:hypothetical protein